MAKKQQKNSIQGNILKILGNQKTLTESTLKELTLEQLKKASNRRQNAIYSVERSLNGLASSGDIVVSGPATNRLLALSEKGRQKLQHQSFDLQTSVVPTLWDGKWRIVLLDFPEYQKQDRDTMRYLLKKARFVCLKKSVWISPYPYEEYMQSLKQNLPSQDSVICILAEKIDADVEARLLEHFRLARQ